MFELAQNMLILTSILSYGIPSIIAWQKNDIYLSIIGTVLTFFSSLYHKNYEKKYIFEDLVCCLYTIVYIFINYLLPCGLSTIIYHSLSFFIGGGFFWYRGYRNDDDTYSYSGYIYHNLWHLVSGTVMGYSIYILDNQNSKAFQEILFYFFVFTMISTVLCNYNYLYMSLINSITISFVFFYLALYNKNYIDVSNTVVLDENVVGVSATLFLFCYFISDMIVNHKEMSSAMWIHHILSACAVFFVYIYYLTNLTIPFLKYEISTIFLNMRSIHPPMKKLYTFLFFITFFILRVVYFAIDVYKIYYSPNIGDNIIWVILPLYFLQIYWFSLMCKKLYYIKNKYD